MKTYVYIGAARGEGEPEGIYIYTQDTVTGNLIPVGSVTDIHNPSFLAVHPNGKYLYAIDEDRSESPSIGYVSAFAIDDETGGLTLLNRQLSQGTGLAHLSTDSEGRFVLTAHYGGGSVSVLPIHDDGKLGEVSSAVQHEGKGTHERQDAPHPHSVFLDAGDNFAFVPDLGTDKVVVYRFDKEKGTLTPHDPAFASVAAESGPRHLAFHPNGRFAYVINELASTVDVFAYDGDAGTLKPLQTITTLPVDYKGQNDTAEILVHPNGRFLYGSNRGHDSMAVFAIDEGAGTLTAVQIVPTQGGHPRNFNFDLQGNFLYAENRDSDNVVVFRVNTDTGELQPTGHVVTVPRPVCLKMVARA